MIVKDFTMPDAYHMRGSATKFPPMQGAITVHDERNPDAFERTYVLTIRSTGMLHMECPTTREGIENLRDACNAALAHVDTEGVLIDAPDSVVRY